MAKGGAKILFGLVFFVLVVAGLAGAGAWFLTELRPPTYRATALLLLKPGAVEPPPAGTGEAVSSVTRILGALGLNATGNPVQLAAPDYAQLFESSSIAEEVRERLLKASATAADAAVTVEDVMNAMDAEVTVALQTRDDVAYQQIIKLHYTAHDPGLAAQGANLWAEACERDMLLESQSRDSMVVAILKEQLEEPQAELDAAREKQEALQAQSPIKPLEMAVMASTEAVEDLKRNIRQAQADAARGDAALKALKAYVSKAPPAVVLELSMTEATTESETAGARAESDFLTAQLPEVEAAAVQARTTWAEALRQHEQVEEEIDRIAPRVNDLREALQYLELAGEQPTRFQIVAEAVEPQAPVGPHRYAIVAGAAILGAIAGMIVYFGLLTLRVYARELDRA